MRVRWPACTVGDGILSSAQKPIAKTCMPNYQATEEVRPPESRAGCSAVPSWQAPGSVTWYRGVPTTSDNIAALHVLRLNSKEE